MKSKYILIEHLRTVQALESLLPQVENIAQKMAKFSHQGGKILWMGNGGSAADCQHLAAELVGHFKRDRLPIASISLTTDTSILTAVSNDYGFHTVFARQLEALGQANDVVVGISTSGRSTNIQEGLRKAREMQLYTVGLTGAYGQELEAIVDDCLIVPSTDVARIQECHILIGHILCELIEETVRKLSEIPL